MISQTETGRTQNMQDTRRNTNMYIYIYNIYYNKSVEREVLFQNPLPSQLDRPQTLEIFERMMLQEKTGEEV